MVKPTAIATAIVSEIANQAKVEGEMDFQSPHTLVSGKRPVWFRRFPDGTGYAINLDHPSGVHYLLKPAADRLQQAFTKCSNPSDLSLVREFFSAASKTDRTLVQKLLDPLGKLAEFHDQLIPDFKLKIKDQVSVWFHISNSCNLACNYCYIPSLRKAVSVPVPGSFPSADLTRRIVFELFNFAEEAGFGALRIRFAGGEPSLVPDLLRVACKEATYESEKRGIPVTFSILTNGVEVTDEFLVLLKEFKFSGISISIDGDADSHDKYRFRLERVSNKISRMGTWHSIFSNIKKMIDHGIHPYVLTTLTETNFRQMDVLVDACVEHHIGFRLSPVRDKSTSRIPGLQDEILEVLRSIYSNLPERLPMSRPIQNYANFAEWSPNVKKSVACGTCRSSFAVNERGEVSTCQMRLETNHGSVETEGLSKIFERMAEHPDNWRFVASNRSTGGCSRCLWRTTCAGGCPEHTKLASLTYDAPSPWCKLYGDFLPIYFHSIASQMKICVDSRLGVLTSIDSLAS